MIKCITKTTSKKNILQAARDGIFLNEISMEKALRQINSVFMNDRTFVLSLIDEAQFYKDIDRHCFVYDVFKCVSFQLTMDAKFAGAILNRNPFMYEVLPEKYKHDFFITKLAVQKYGRNLQYADEELRNIDQIAMDAIHTDYSAFEFVGDELKDDSNFVCYAVANHNASCIQYASDRIKNDYDTAWDLIHLDIGSLEYLPDELKDNFDIVFETVKIKPSMIEYASDRLKNDSFLQKFIQNCSM